jgi:TorA maturation chaperone TorD
LYGLKPEFSASVQAIPELSVLAPGLGSASPVEFDRLAADHYTLFGLNVFPHESIFLDGEGDLGGAVSSSVLAFYQQAGYDVLLAGENPDHIGLELRLLAHLAAAESEAWEDGLPTVVQRLSDLQRRFLDEHLLRWLPGLVQAIRQQDEGFFSALADLSLELASEHIGSQEREPASAHPDFELPRFPDLLVHEKTSLKDFAHFLLTPACSGFYLSREDISRLASSLKIPRGFGSREQMLANLLRAAADYESLPPLVEGITTLLGDWIGFYEAMAEDQPVLAFFAAPWLQRLHATQAQLARYSSQIY